MCEKKLLIYVIEMVPEDDIFYSCDIVIKMTFLMVSNVKSGIFRSLRLLFKFSLDCFGY